MYWRGLQRVWKYDCCCHYDKYFTPISVFLSVCPFEYSWNSTVVLSATATAHIGIHNNHIYEPPNTVQLKISNRVTAANI